MLHSLICVASLWAPVWPKHAEHA